MKKICINDTWQFRKITANMENASKIVSLPYDAMIREKRIPRLAGGETSAYYPGGAYEYTRELVLPESGAETAILEFEGIWQKAKIYLDGKLLGEHINGYTSFYLPIPDDLPRGSHMLKVTADNTQIPNSRWYTGSGIYRDVYLHIGGQKSILPGSIRIRTVSTADSTIRAEWNMTDAEDTVMNLSVKLQEEIVVKASVPASSSGTEIRIPNGQLWCAETPVLYTLTLTAVTADGTVLDTAEEPFGIRSLEWGGEGCLKVNGKEVKLRGACIHHDNGIIGSSEFRQSAYRRIRILKECGYNAIRAAHNPASTWILKACDELGMYVMDEFTDVWRGSKNPYDYALYFDTEWERDIESMVFHDFNHPSVIMYSTGNEIYDISHLEANDTQRKLAEKIRSLDDTRPLTCGINVLAASKQSKKPVLPPRTHADDTVNPCREGRGGLNSSKLMNFAATLLPKLQEKIGAEKLYTALRDYVAPLDFIGLNYGTHLTRQFAELYPQLRLVHSETYPSKLGKTWQDTVASANACGDFGWTGWDYLGETGIGVPDYGKGQFRISEPYPCAIGGVGSVSITGELGAQAAYTSIIFGQTESPYIAVHPLDHSGDKCNCGQWRLTDAVNSWSWQGYEGKTAAVDIYTLAAITELKLNGRSLGRVKPVNGIASFTTAYEPGTLTAVAYDKDGRLFAASELKTAGAERRLTARAEHTEIMQGGSEVAYVHAALTDSEGIVHPVSGMEIAVTVEGTGTLEGFGSGDPYCITFADTKTKSWYGTAVAAIRSGTEAGEIKVVFRADGIESAPVIINVKGKD